MPHERPHTPKLGTAWREIGNLQNRSNEPVNLAERLRRGALRAAPRRLQGSTVWGGGSRHRNRNREPPTCCDGGVDRRSCISARTCVDIGRGVLVDAPRLEPPQSKPHSWRCVVVLSRRSPRAHGLHVSANLAIVEADSSLGRACRLCSGAQAASGNWSIRRSKTIDSCGRWCSANTQLFRSDRP